MAEYNFSKMCEDWAEQQSLDTPDYKIEGRANLNNLKLSVEDISWSGFRQLVNEESQKVSVQFNPMQPSLYSGLHASKESEMITEAHLTRGVVKGLNTPLRLPVRGQSNEIQKILGGYVTIDPGTKESRSSNKMTVTLGSSHQANANQPTQARVSSKQTAYEIHFTAKVSCLGIVTFSQDSTDEQVFAQIIADLQERGHDLSLVVNRKNGFADSVSFQMAGRCVFRGEFEQEINWQY
ncbi:unnamed protein product [Lymnaea stagnalis]|uniref:Uncharacterized protein n=1 Tax=Lymnaea stagnalis TaxID=6523 RepID=A0AAV2HT92_LYMST